MAVATSMMLPVSLVAAKAVASAPNWVSSAVAVLSFLLDDLIAWNILRCGKCRQIIRKIWVKKKKIIKKKKKKKKINNKLKKKTPVYEIYYRLKNNLKKRPVCIICGKPVKYTSDHYAKFSSKECQKSEIGKKQTK